MQSEKKESLGYASGTCNWTVSKGALEQLQLVNAGLCPKD